MCFPHLTAVTGYSPSVIALNDMLRQQLALTTQFIETQRRLHDNYVNMLHSDFQYTTLEDTKKVKYHDQHCISYRLAFPIINNKVLEYF
jgi:hypothetical protein